MSDLCFICLEKTNNKVCFRCNCYAHPKCWFNYTKKSCPVCKGNNIIEKPFTRSQTSFLDKKLVCNLMNTIKDLDRSEFIQFIHTHLIMISNTNSNREIIRIFEFAMYLIYAGKKLGGELDILRCHEPLRSAIKGRINVFKGLWKNADKFENVLLR